MPTGRMRRVSYLLSMVVLGGAVYLGRNLGYAVWGSIVGGIVILLGVLLTIWPPEGWVAKGSYVLAFAGLGFASIFIVYGQEAQAKRDQAAADGARQQDLWLAQERQERLEQQIAELKRQTERSIRAIVEMPAVAPTPNRSGPSAEILLANQRKVHRKAIAEWLTKGDLIKAQCDSLQERPELGGVAQKWLTEMAVALGKLDPAYPAIIRNPTAFSYARSVGGKPVPAVNDQVWNFVNARTEALNRILERIPN